MLNARIFIAVSLLGAIAAPLSAHPKLLSTTPAAKATVKPTTKVELHFSEKLLDKLTDASVSMTDMPGMKMTAPQKMSGKVGVGADGKTLVVTLDAPLVEGTYSVDWHAVAADTHRVQGTFAFTVK